VRYFDAAQRPDPPLADLSPAEVLNPPESPLRALGRSIHREWPRWRARLSRPATLRTIFY